MVSYNLPAFAPVLSANQRGITVIPTCFCPWEDSPELSGIGGSVMAMGYLVDIWGKICAPAQSTQPSVAQVIRDSGVLPIGTNGAGARVSFAELELFDIPDDSDAIFGSPNLIYAGMCGFGYVDIVQQTVTGAGIAGALIVGASNSRFGPANFINHDHTGWTPPDPNMNMFWWKLKPGFQGLLTLNGTLNNNAQFACQFGNWYHWNPSAGGWGPNDDLSVKLFPQVDGCNRVITAPGVELPSPPTTG